MDVSFPRLLVQKIAKLFFDIVYSVRRGKEGLCILSQIHLMSKMIRWAKIYRDNLTFNEKCKKIKVMATTQQTLQAFIANSDRQNGLKFHCNQEATLVRGERPLIDFNYSSIWR